VPELRCFLELCEAGAIHIYWNFVRVAQYIYAYWNFMSVAQYNYVLIEKGSQKLPAGL
jgi:hypothetical protein